MRRRRVVEADYDEPIRRQRGSETYARVHDTFEPAEDPYEQPADTYEAPAQVHSHVRAYESETGQSVQRGERVVSGFIFTVYGLLALVRAGFDGFPTHQVTVGAITVSSLVAVLTIAVGLGLLASSVSGPSVHPGLVFFSALMLVIGIVVVGDSASLPLALRASPGFGWLTMVLGVAMLVATLLPYRDTARWSLGRSPRL
jgi:hypothetical protein